MTAVSEPQLERVSYAEAAGILATREPVLGRLIEAAGPLLALSDETLRAVGVSANRARSLRDLSTKVLDGTVIPVRQGYGLAWNVPMPTAAELEPLGDRYRPYPTVVARYCWRAVELYAAGTESAVTR